MAALGPYLENSVGFSCGTQALEHVGSVAVGRQLSFTVVCGISIPQPVKPPSPALEGRFFTTEPPEKSLPKVIFFFFIIDISGFFPYISHYSSIMKQPSILNGIDPTPRTSASSVGLGWPKPFSGIPCPLATVIDLVSTWPKWIQLE